MAAPVEMDAMFSLPFEGNFDELNNSDKLCVVGIFGKGRPGHSSKTSVVNKLLNRNVFPIHFPDDENEEHTNPQESCSKIEAYYDQRQKILYLHLVSVYDTAVLCQIAQHLQDKLSNAESHKKWKDFELRHAKALLYLFTVCHFVMVIHPTSRFDLHLVRLFKALENIRQKVQNSISEQLKDLPIPKEWQSNGRMCTPRLLFVCQQSHLTAGEREDDHEQTKGKPIYQKKPPLKRLLHSLEDQIYRILRKSRVLTNQSAHSLFSVPANQTFVHIETDEALTSDPVSMLITQLNNHTFASKETGKVRTRSYQASRTRAGKATSGSSGSNSHGNRSKAQANKDEETLHEFLWQHANLVLSGKGFDDSIGRSVTSTSFQVPSCQSWFRVSSKLYDFFFNETTDKKVQGHWTTLRSMLDLDMRFSESRCGKVLPLASRTYQDKLPDHYTSAVHLNKLSQAMRVFSQHARGPAYEQLAEQLRDECEKFWHNNRRLCEVVSLTGQHCIHPLHIVPGTKEEISAKTNKDETSRPIMPHSSHCKTTSACNCGRKQGQREDPFDIKAANYDFYQTMESKCCNSLDPYKFPVFQPSEDESLEPKEISAGDLHLAHAALAKTDSSSTDQGRAETQPGPLSIALSLGQSGGSDIFGTHNSHNSSAGGMLDILSVPDIHVTGHPHKEKLQPRRQASTTEYLAGMLHSNSPPGLLPKFPSWSLVCLGNADSYKAAIGLDFPGFFHGSNHLLPWDIPIPSEAKSEQHWPQPSESGGGRRSSKKMDKRSQKDIGDSHVRAYIGDEYECPRGGRFICSGPDKMVKMTSSGNIKETANKLVTMDMPLYFPCACRSVKSHRAQLTRVYVVTPESAVHIRLNPRVQPGPGSNTPVFNTGVGDDGILLPTNGMWVLRLPYVYVGDNGPILPPADPQVPFSAKLLKGLFTIKSASTAGTQKK
ncbi:nonsense-mediated mRNA decay factor SMG8-like [Ptychodera flava]|uniref:nonsense-mediated mRNA decay factor SMG8-like n=1 Tax=Ptychodera flava TaxID=63121 RepID=UPI003969EDB6